MFEIRKPIRFLLLAAAMGCGQPIISRADDDTNIDNLHLEMMEAAGIEAHAPAISAGNNFEFEYVNNLTGKAPYRKARRGIMLVGRGDTLRALEPFKGSSERAGQYASVINTYAEKLGPKVRVYCMPVPVPVAYYCPDDAAANARNVRRQMIDIFSNLSPEVEPVDIYPTLALHVDEPIYSRTDHHWAPLGAYYASGCFAECAGVDFFDLSNYQRHDKPGYVGTMYKFSGDMAVKRAPETFTYYTPLDSNYSVTYTVYTLDKARLNVIDESSPINGSFFQSASGSATYLTFMGGDTRLTCIDTGVDTPRRLAIVKDSYGNAIPPYLIGSFNQIHVIDCRYFTRNIVDYIDDNGITDLLFVNNMSHAVNPRTSDTLLRYLNQ